MSCLRLLRRELLRPNCIVKITSIYYSQALLMQYEKSEKKFKKMDNITDEWSLIYKAPMEPWVKLLSVYLTSSTSFIAVSSVYYLLNGFDISNLSSPVLLGDIVVANSAIQFGTYIGIFIGFHYALRRVLNKYVVRLYKNNDDYSAIFMGYWYNSNVKHNFKVEDFQKLKPNPIVTWSDAHYKLGNKKGILLDTYFKTPGHFNYLMYKRTIEDLTE